MKRPTLTKGILAAVTITIAAVFVQLFVLVFFIPQVSLILAVATLISLYGLYLIRNSERTPGRFLATLFLLVGQGSLILMGFGPTLLAICGVTQIWLIRSYFFSKSVAGWFFDGSVIAIGLMAALIARSAGMGFGGMAWSFLLVQALFVILPAAPFQPLEGKKGSGFERAKASAEEALERIGLSKQHA